MLRGMVIQQEETCDVREKIVTRAMSMRELEMTASSV